jgi:hypothetical protein
MEISINALPVALGAESFPTPAKGGIACSAFQLAGSNAGRLDHLFHKMIVR